jgi:hypothetical protein
MTAFKIQKRRRSLLGLIFALAMGLQVYAAYAQDSSKDSAPDHVQDRIQDQGNQSQSDKSGVVNHRWVNEPSAGLVGKLGQWRLQFMLGDRTNAPSKGIFPSSSPTQEPGAVHLVTSLASSPTIPIKLTPVAPRTRYVSQTAGATDPNDRVVTTEILDVLRSPEVSDFLAARHLDKLQLDVEKDLAVALVQDFYAALRAPNKKEHIWSINWRVDNGYGNANYAGYEVWGLFTEEGGVLKPIYLTGDESSGETPSATYYYILAAGDLDGDGIDELITRQMVFESEEDDIELMAWENGAPVWVTGFPASTDTVR